MVPPNLTFIVDDIEEPWLFDEQFDMIHLRMMVGSIHDWPLLFSRAYAQLRPGGVIELQDVHNLESKDGTFVLDPPSGWLAEWWAESCRAFERMGRSMLAAKHHMERLRAAGFVDVREERFEWPLNTWPEDQKLRELGASSELNTLAALEAIAMAPLTRALKWTVEGVQLLLAGARTDVRNTRIRASWDM
jgi:SAM-dependent methyltransferase